jgi:hypothetical protein
MAGIPGGLPRDSQQGGKPVIEDREYPELKEQIRQVNQHVGFHVPKDSTLEILVADTQNGFFVKLDDLVYIARSKGEVCVLVMKHLNERIEEDAEDEGAGAGLPPEVK